MRDKPKVAFYWCSSCGGCEEAIVDLNEGLLSIANAVDIVLWPATMDFKYKDVETLDDGAIAASFINGAIRTEEQVHLAELLRRKSRLIIAFGSCAHMGGIPGLANLTTKAAIFERSYLDSPTVVNPSGTVPVVKSEKASVTLPAFFEQVYALDQVIDVDYYLPGCPPMQSGIQDAMAAVLEGKRPPKGAVLAPNKSLCDSCERRKTKQALTKISRVYRPHEIEAHPDICFLEQGIICMGPATRSGCGEACIRGNMPCTGCYGPPSGVTDQGSKMLAALASLFEAREAARSKQMADQVPDPAGSFSRYSVPKTYLTRRRCVFEHEQET